MSAPDTIRIALIGAGIFARDSHVPAITSLGDTFRIVAICSRSPESGQQLARQIAYPVDTTTDIDAVLARDDVEAVDIMLPIPLIPGAIRKALDAGKHVISEKPASPTLAAGRDLLDRYARRSDRVWMVAENWRYEPVMQQAADIVRSGEIGRPLVAQFNHYVPMMPDNKYYQTPWRHAGEFPGGFLLDGGVHYIALLRMVLGEIAAVQAVSAHMRPDLPPADTLIAALEFVDGLRGGFGVTYATDSPWTQTLHVAGERGALLMQRDEVRVFTDGQERTLPGEAHQGVVREMAAFAAAIRDGEPHHNTPQAGVQDVAVIEALLRSAESGARVVVERVV